jgi:hypothetical protein
MEDDGWPPLPSSHKQPHTPKACSKQANQDSLSFFFFSSLLSLSLSLSTHPWMASTSNHQPRITAPHISIDIPNPSNKTQIQHTALTLIKNNLRHAHNIQQQNINHEYSASQLLTTKT